MTIFQILPLLAAAVTANVGLVFLVADRLSPGTGSRRVGTFRTTTG